MLVENYRPGALAALGLGADAMMALNPRLIYASMSAYGQDGPRGSQTGYDMNIQASSGIMAMTGTETVNPLMLGPSAVDYASGTTGRAWRSRAPFSSASGPDAGNASISR